MTISEIRKLYEAAAGSEILDAYREIDMEATDPFHSDESPLHLACSMADADGAALLLERGGNPNQCDRCGRTPLHALAALEDRYRAFPETAVRRCADLLLDAKASVARRDEDRGDTPITLAGKNGRFELLQSAAAHGVKLTATDRNGNSALHLACEYAGQVAELLQYRNSEEETANLERRAAQFLKSAQALLEDGLDPEDKNNRNQSALELAILSKADKLSVLLSGGDPGHLESTEGRWAGMTLHQAVVQKNLDAIRANAELGADLNAAADEGEFAGLTPLAVACYTFELPTAALLLELGADPNFKDGLGRTAIAKWFAHLGDFYLDGKKAQDKAPLTILAKLLERGMDKDGTVNDRSDTPLLGACTIAARGKEVCGVRMGRALAKALLAAGCDPNRANLEGVTPLMTLCAQADSGIASLLADLIDAGADLHAADRRGNTALHYAASSSSPSAGKELAELLLDSGFEQVDAVNNDGKSALELAGEKNNEPLVKLILMQS